MSEEMLNEIGELLKKGKANEVEAKVKEALEANIPVKQILNEGLIGAMAEIGEKFKKNEVYVPEVLIAARAMNSGLAAIEPALVDAGVEPVGTVAIGTVKGDLHDIGKNLVAMMLKGAGFKVIDLGVDVGPEKFVEAVKDQGAKVLGLSALLTTTMPQMKSIIEAVTNEGLEVKTCIGGAPVTQAYADEIGADGYAPDAASAVDVVKQLSGV